MNKLSILIFFLFFAVNNLSAGNRLDSLLTVLDERLEHSNVYDQQKENRISLLKKELTHAGISDSTLHHTYLNLYKEYEAYIFDSAMYYAKEHYKISEKQHDTHWINECKMQLARMNSTFADFSESVELLNSIKKEELTPIELGTYYNSYAEVYIYWGEYSNREEIEKYVKLKDTYQDSALMILPHNSFDYIIGYGRKCIELKNFDQAEKILLPNLSNIETHTRKYAILTSLIAYMYELKGNAELQKEYLAMSAISDIEAAVKENTSMRFLAFLLWNDGNNMDRSNRYIKKSLEDANFYNARLRNIQIAKILPIIDKAYQLERERHQKRLQIALAVIAVLLLFVTCLVLYLFQQMKKLARARKEVVKANDELKKTNAYLSETSHIKEEYIGLFLNQCSIYIDKLEAYRKALNKKAASGKMEELFQMIKSSQIIEDELKDFYRTFDSAFLNIFPDFVEQFNQLLPEEEKIVPKTKENLTIELRIFALIRLGITDSSKIANFLRYSITTIYNYRSKYRNKALVGRDDFEEIVMKIATYKLS